MADYRNDPEWQAARQEMIAELPGDDCDRRLVRTICAALRLYEIESGQPLEEFQRKLG